MKLISILLLTLQLNNISSLNILGIFPYNGKSHFIVYRTYLLELANRGHNVTVISPFPEKEPPKNYHDIVLADRVDVFTVDLTLESPLKTLWKLDHFVFTSGNENCAAMLETKQITDLVKHKVKFDLVVFEQFNTDCALGIAYKLDAPTVALSSSEPTPWHYDRLGFSVTNSPFILIYGGKNPSLLRRVAIAVHMVAARYYYIFFMQRTDQNILAKYFDDVPPLKELAKDIKFLLLNQNFVLSGLRNFPSNVIEVGGFHVPKAKPLSANLKKFIEESQHGVVFISFGSVIKISTLPTDKLQAILDAMKELPQRFIWKLENSSLQVDKNKVYTDRWLPQVDILAHPKTVAFFTHAGLGSTIEGTYHGVPMLAMPIAADQPLNAASTEQSGMGLQLKYEDLTKEHLVATMKKILEPKFRERVKHISKAWHDRPQTAMDTAIFWTEFAARYPTISPHNPVLDIPLYQFLFLDVFAVILLVTITPVVILIICCKKKNKLHKGSAKKTKKQ